MKEKFSLDLISKSHEKYENLKTITIFMDVDGELKETELDIYKIFSPVKIEECITELINNMDKIRRLKGRSFNLEGVIEPYLMWLIVKYFTELEDSMPKKFEDQIISIKEMINTGVLYQIIANFDTEQIELIRENLEIAVETFENNKDVLDKLKLQISKELADKTLLE